MNTRLAVLGAALGLASPALGQLEYATDFNHPFTWSENVGWSWWADNGPSGMKIFDTFIGGWIWFENVGWVSLGDGTPGNNGKYANVNGTDFGVNRSNNNLLTGFGWGENIGWINFSAGAMADPPNAARFDEANLRLRGYAWGENIGWLNLADAEHYIGVITVNDCYADCDASGALDLFDFLCFVNAFNTEEDYADCDGNGGWDLFDFLCYVNAFNEGCL
jgi:hypothetical protein